MKPSDPVKYDLSIIEKDDHVSIHIVWYGGDNVFPDMLYFYHEVVEKFEPFQKEHGITHSVEAIIDLRAVGTYGSEANMEFRIHDFVTEKHPIKRREVKEEHAARTKEENTRRFKSDVLNVFKFLESFSELPTPDFSSYVPKIESGEIGGRIEIVGV